MIIAKVGGKCHISHEYVLVKVTHPTLVYRCGSLQEPGPSWFLYVYLGEKPCIEESGTVALVLLLMKYWSSKQGRVGFSRKNLYRITAIFDSK